MSRRLPPLQTLRAFEAAARHLNFTRAAEELNLTHGAISHQVAALESQLGRKLFKREGRGMVLDPTGVELANRLREHFDGIGAALAAVRAKPDDATLVVSVLPSFAAHWLLPRLADFVDRHPGIALHLQTSVGLADFQSDGVMLAIRYGQGRWPGLAAEQLHDETLFPVAAPSLKKPRSIDGLREVPALVDVNHPWALWLDAVGKPDLKLRIASTYSDSGLMLDAATRGLGVALARSTIAQRALDDGRLVRWFAREAMSPRRYYLVHPPALANDARVAAFKRWMVEQMAAG
jgi:LysR family glycine cleavage system transcriptional activator